MIDNIAIPSEGDIKLRRRFAWATVVCDGHSLRFSWYYEKLVFSECNGWEVAARISGKRYVKIMNCI